MRDQMDNPLDRAAFWIEYVIRHRGAPHLKPNAYCQQSVVERELLDVIFILSSILILLGYISLRITSRLGSKILKRIYVDQHDKIKTE
jgi:glucuronosyltransferase